MLSTSPKGGLEKQDRFRRLLHVHASRERNDNRRRRRAHNRAEHQSKAETQAEQKMRRNSHRRHREGEVDQRQRKRGTDRTANNVEIQAEARFKKDDDQRDRREYRADIAEIRRPDQMKHRPRTMPMMVSSRTSGTRARLKMPVKACAMKISVPTTRIFVATCTS
jgi:hypothetical protein